MTNDTYFVDDAENEMGRCLVLKTSWSDEFVNIITEEDISVIRLSESMGWRGNDISFLEKLCDTGIRGVEVYAWDLKDITPLRYIRDLEYLGLQCQFTKAPDFSSFTKLKICKLHWRPKARSIFDCSGLTILNVVNFPDDDLMQLVNMSKLIRLQITSRKLMSLAGIENLESLRILDLANCPRLGSLIGVEEVSQLEVLELDNCKKVDEIFPLSKLTNLRKIVLMDCGRLHSLKPVIKCRSLESLNFAGDTSVEDGELGMLLDLPELNSVIYSSRSHYSHKQSQIQRSLR